jgi:hypothetical protein
MDGRERVKRAVEFRSPDRIPFEWYKHGEGEPDLERSDLVWVRYKPFSEPVIVEEGDEVRKTDEWGCTWVSYKSIPTMGQPLGHPLREWDRIEGFQFPGYDVNRRFEGLVEEVDLLRDLGKYLVGTLDFGLWERLHFLRGLNEAISDLYLHRERAHLLLERITEFKLELIKGYSGLGIDCVGFTDDWGDQHSLMIPPKLWVEVFKPYYERLFGEAKAHGMHTFLHSCGNIREIIGHLIEAGLDIVQLDAPHQCDVAMLSEEFSGEICFDCCIDIQKVLPTGDRDLIFEEARLLTRSLGSVAGGFIARQYPQLVHIGIPPKVNEMAYQAFQEWGTYT